MKKLAKFFPLLFAFLNIDMEAKMQNGETLELSDDDKTKLNAAAKIEGFAEKFMKEYNAALEAEGQNEEILKLVGQYMKDAKAEEDPEASEEGEGEGENEDTAPEANTSSLASVKQLISRVTKLEGKAKQLEAENKKLAALPEGDEGIEKIKANAMNTNKVAHSKTHLFAKNDAPWNAFEGRPWNQAARDGKLSADTNWGPADISRINEDLGAYARKNATEIFSLLMDGLEIPANWKVVTGITDEAIMLQIVTGEITQGFKAQWLPKNNQRFEPIKNKIFDIQIDATWTVTQLKAIERSYLQQYFNKTSSPYKDDFVAFLAKELIKQARKEDKIAVFKGVFYQTPEDATKGGRFINKMDGMLKIMGRYRDVVYKSHKLGTPTEENIYDYINNWVKSLPYDVRILPLDLGLSDYWHKAYHNARERAKGTNNDYQRNETHVEQYANIKFVPHAQLEGQDFMYITIENNLGVMFNVAGEESTLTIEKIKRNIDAYADYKFGFFVSALGATKGTGDNQTPLGYEHQVFFSNDVEILQDVYIPADANDATPSVAAHNALIIGSTNTAATSITKIDDVKEGQYVYLFGDSDTNVSTVTAGANILLDGGNFALANGNLLKLRGLAGGKVIEISRTLANSEPQVEKVILAADATTADAVEGNVFVTQANTAATAFTDIENAVAGVKYTIEGGSDTNATTIANGGKFFLTAAMTLTTGKFLTVEFNGTKFVEYARG